MPARKEKLYIVISRDNQPDREMDFPLWWDRRRFFERFGKRQIDTGHPIYVNYGLLMTPQEAFEWNKSCLTSYYTKLAKERPDVLAAMQALQSALKSARWVIVESNEWESGLD